MKIPVYQLIYKKLTGYSQVNHIFIVVEYREESDVCVNNIGKQVSYFVLLFSGAESKQTIK